MYAHYASIPYVWILWSAFKRILTLRTRRIRRDIAIPTHINREAFLRWHEADLRYTRSYILIAQVAWLGLLASIEYDMEGTYGIPSLLMLSSLVIIASRASLVSAQLTDLEREAGIASVAGNGAVVFREPDAPQLPVEHTVHHLPIGLFTSCLVIGVALWMPTRELRMMLPMLENALGSEWWTHIPVWRLILGSCLLLFLLSWPILPAVMLLRRNARGVSGLVFGVGLYAAYLLVTHKGMLDIVLTVLCALAWLVLLIGARDISRYECVQANAIPPGSCENDKPN